MVAGFSAAQRLDSVIMLPAQALGTAVNSMAGQNIGVNRWERVFKIAKYGLFYNLLIMFAIATFIFLFAGHATRLFIQEPDAVRFGKKYLQTIALFYPFLGINFVLNIISFWVLRYPLTLTFSTFLGDMGIAIGMGVSFVISSIIAYLYYRYGGWKRKKLFSKV